MNRHLLVGVLVATTGCAHFLKLDPKTVTALQLADDSAAQICARGSLVDVIAVTKDGQKHAEGDRVHPKENEFDLSLVRLDASVGTFNDRSWNPPADALAMLPVGEVTVTATLIANPSVTATTKFTPTWACEPPAAYVGGQDGPQGDSGDGDGGNGGPGQAGESAQAVSVTLGWVQHGSGQLAIADVQSNAGESIYVLDPTTPLSIFARGGAGGPGALGSFGRGMDGCEGRGGRGGKGGDGGDGGDGADVTLRYDAQTPELERMVNIDVRGGDPGPAGDGGSGGSGPNGCGEWGPTGDSGKEGRGGRDGRVSKQPSRGINQQLASLATSAPSERPAPRPAAPMPARPGTPPRPTDTSDGARYYTGRAEISAILPHRRPQKQRQQVRIESTRTRRRHFTLTFGGCKLDFHRAPNEKQHRYVLDGPASCTDNTGAVTIKDATLELPGQDELDLTWHGTGFVQGMGNLSVDFAFKGHRG